MADAEKLEALEQKNMQYYTERLARLNAQLSNLKLQEGLLRQELDAAQNEFAAVRAEMITKYKLAPQDTINLQTGEVRREQKETAP